MIGSTHIAPGTERFAHALLLVDGRYALQLRDADLKFCPSHWGFFGGMIEKGEKARDGLIREIREELELDASGARFVFLLHGRWHFYALDVTDQWQRRVLHEGQDARTFDPEEIGPLLRHSIVDEAISRHRRLFAEAA